MEENIKIGQLLQRARKQKNVSLDDVANKTKININLLRALEDNNLDGLPNKTYVKGFVKNLAKILGINTDDALKALDRVYKELEPEPEVEEVSEKAEEKAAPTPTPKESSIKVDEIQDQLQGILGQIFNKKFFIGVAAVVVAFLIIKGIVSFFSNISEEKDRLVESQKDEAQIKPAESSIFEMESAKKLAQENATETAEVEEVKEQKKEEPKAKVVEEKKEEKKEAVKEEEEKKEVVKKEEEKKEAAPSLPPGKYPFVKFYPAPKNLYSLSEDDKNEDFLPESIKDAMDDDKHNLFINAVEGDTWISYQKDGDDIKRYILKKGRTLFLQADDVILLFLGNFNATKIFYNNKLVEANTRTGVKSLIFPEDKATDYKLPLFPSYNGAPQRQDLYIKNMVEETTSEQ